MKQNDGINKYGLFICSGTQWNSRFCAGFVYSYQYLDMIYFGNYIRVYSYALKVLSCTIAKLPLAVLNKKLKWYKALMHTSFLPSTFWDDKGCYFILSSWMFLSLTEKWLFSISKKTAVFASFSLHLSRYFYPVFQKCIGLCGSTRDTFRRLALGRDSLQ